MNSLEQLLRDAMTEQTEAVPPPAARQRSAGCRPGQGETSGHGLPQRARPRWRPLLGVSVLAIGLQPGVLAARLGWFRRLSSSTVATAAPTSIWLPANPAPRPAPASDFLVAASKPAARWCPTACRAVWGRR